MTPNEVDGKVTIKGLQIERLTIEDYLPWLDGMKQDIRARNDALIPSNMRADDRYERLKQNAAYDPSPDDCIPLLWAAWFQIKVIDKALEKSKIDKKTADLKLLPIEAREAALRLSGLLNNRQIEAIINPKPASAQQQQQQGQTFGQQQDRAQRPLPVTAELPDESQPPQAGDPVTTFVQK